MGSAYTLHNIDAMESTVSRQTSDEHWSGRQMEPDPLSSENERARTLGALNHVALEIIDHSKLMEAQRDCPDVAAHRQGKHPANLNMTDYEFSPGIILFCDVSDGKKARPLVPKPFRDVVIRMFHCLGHKGQKPTLQKVAARYYWPTMRQDVSRVVSACPDCAAVNIGKTIKPPMSHRPIIAKRFSDIMVDIVGPIPESRGFRYLLTVIDRTTRFVDAIPMKEANANTCCEAFLGHWVSRFGLPRTACSDNGNTFVAQLWSKMHESLGTLVTYTPPYHAASLGSLERQHRDIKSSLKAALHHMGDEHGHNWYSVLPWILLDKRTTYQPELGVSPAELVYGETLLVPGDLIAGELSPDSNLPNLLDRVRRNAARPPVQTSHHSVPAVHLPADLKAVSHVMVKRGKTAPLGANFDGPFPVVDHVGTSCVKIIVGHFVNGEPRYEIQHWNNCKIPKFLEQPFESTKPALGRKKAK